MKKLIAVLLALVMVLGLVACGAQEEAAATEETVEEVKEEVVEEAVEEEVAPMEEPEEEITLYWVGAGWSQNDKATKIIEKWEAIHPNIKIEYIEPGTSADDAYKTNLDTMIAGGTTVDVTYLTYADVYARVMNGAALPLDSYIAAAGDDYEDMYGSLATQMLEYEGAIYGIPYAGNTFKVFYNKDITDAAGITIPETMSLDELTEIIVALKDVEGLDYAAVLPYTWYDVIYAASTISGWNMAVKDADGNVVPNFDDETFKANLQWAIDMAVEYEACPDYNTMVAESINRRQYLITEKTALIMDGPYTLVWMQNYMYNDPAIGDLPFTLGVADVPYASEEGKEVSYNTVAGAFYVPKTSAHPQEAYEFAKFICNECPEEAANYMPIYKDADMEAATKSFTEYTDANGNVHTGVYELETAKAAVATPYESYVGKFGYDATLAVYNSALYTLLEEQWSMLMSGEMELQDWVDMMQELGAAEIANVG